MRTEDRIRALSNVTPSHHAAVDAALAGQQKLKRAASLRLYRMGDAARETGLSRCTLWRACKEKRIRAVEIRKGSFRIPEAELHRIVEGRS